MDESNEITVGDIMSIVYVKNKDLAKRSDFSRKLEHHELIFRISGSCEVEFDDQKFIEKRIISDFFLAARARNIVPCD